MDRYDSTLGRLAMGKSLPDPEEPDAEVEWKPPRWVFYKKHCPARIKDENAARIRSSRSGEGKATYLIPREQIEILELRAVGPSPDGVGPNEILPRKTLHTRHFWLDAGHVIGASDGELTSFIYVIYGSSGEVHGYPITAQELKRKGVEL